MVVMGRLLVAMLVASCATALLIGLWGGVLFTLHPHWMFQVLFILIAIAVHFFAVYRMYFLVKRKWF
jgi:hypothetical protein